MTPLLVPEEQLSPICTCKEQPSPLGALQDQCSPVGTDDDKLTTTTAGTCSTDAGSQTDTSPAPPTSPFSPQDFFPDRLDWEFDCHSHPMVTEGEKEFVNSCVEAMAERFSLAEGHLSGLLSPRSRNAPLSPRAALCRGLQAVLQDRVRTGADSVFVEPGYLMSLGGKKIVKLWMGCASGDTTLSVCWDWSLKLEPRAEM